jgi:HEAT repeat protein
MAELALGDHSPEVRSAAAAALGEMGLRSSIPKLRGLTDDKDPSVALAAPHALVQLKDDSGYDVYYEILTENVRRGREPSPRQQPLRIPRS